MMCVLSMVVDHYRDQWRERVSPAPVQPVYVSIPQPPPLPRVKPLTDEEVEDFRKLVERAREYDKRNGEPDCSMDDKKREVKELADKLGVKIDFL